MPMIDDQVGNFQWSDRLMHFADRFTPRDELPKGFKNSILSDAVDSG